MATPHWTLAVSNLTVPGMTLADKCRAVYHVIDRFNWFAGDTVISPSRVRFDEYRATTFVIVAAPLNVVTALQFFINHNAVFVGSGRRVRICLNPFRRGVLPPPGHPAFELRAYAESVTNPRRRWPMINNGLLYATFARRATVNVTIDAAEPVVPDTAATDATTWRYRWDPYTEDPNAVHPCIAPTSIVILRARPTRAPLTVFSLESTF